MPVSSTKWRLYCYTAQSGGVNIAIAEIEMHTSIGGADVCTGGTVNASYNNGSYPKDNAFDNNADTFWWTDSLNHWIEYEFASPVSIAEIAITARNDGYHSDSPASFDFQFYDTGSSSYVTAMSKTAENTWTSGQTRTYSFTPLSLAGTITESLGVDKWRVTAHKCVDGTLVSSQAVTGSSYTIYTSNATPCNVTLAPHIDYAWSVSKVVALNEYCVPSNPDTTPRLYKATDIGSSPNQTGGSEPTWPSSGTVVDNDITWTYVADLVDPVSLGPKIPS